MTTLATPGQVIAKLDEIERDLAGRLNDFEAAADDRARLIRDWEHRMAIHTARARGTSAEIRKANALVAAVEQDTLYERLTDAEARYDALRVVVKVLEDRSTIGMSILRAQGRA
jgi:hypothetical protein